MAAALIHHHHIHHRTKTTATTTQNPIKIVSFLSPSQPSLPLSYPKPQLLSLTNCQSYKHTAQPRLSSHELVQLLKLSGDHSDTQLNRVVHAWILKTEELPQIRLFNSLISAYLENGELDYAYRVFDSILTPDVVSYTAMISGLTKSGLENEAVGIFFEMIRLGVEPNEYTFVALLSASMRLFDSELGSQIHAFVIKTGFVNFLYVANALMGLYGKCGCSSSMMKLFDDMREKDVASWNTVISCTVKDGMYDRAFELLDEMLRVEDCGVDHYTLSSIFTACARNLGVKQGRSVHAYAVKLGYESNLSVKNSLIEFYSKCGLVEQVETLFYKTHVRDVFTWTEMINCYMRFRRVDLALEIFDKMPEKNSVSYNSLLSGFCQNGEGLRALTFFCKMLSENIELTDFALTSVLNACGLIGDSKISKQIHAFVLKLNSGLNDHIIAALLDMYTRCDRIDDAEKIFHRSSMQEDGSGSIMLTTMICGFARNSEPIKALSLINQWKHKEHCFMDEVALASILGVCGDLGCERLGEQFHSYALKLGFLSDIGLGNALISMYSKCCDMEKADNVFNRMPARDIVSWNSVINGHILNRQGDNALHVWSKMQKQELLPDVITCVLIISAYRHTTSNLVTHCKDFFRSMKSSYHIEPDSDHYTAFVTVLGHWGLLQEAEELLINEIQFESNISVWRALLDSCRLHQNIKIGTRVAKKILSFEPHDSSTYILKSNLYSASNRWQCSEHVREEMKRKGLRKIPARSWIVDENNRVHMFFARDKSHFQSKDVYSALDILFMECLKIGHVPDKSFVLHDVEDHQKINFLLYHSGKLAVTYGLLTTKPGKPVKVFKNVHLCGDCHAFFRHVSLVTKREIRVRDASGLHCFAKGVCSCKDNRFCTPQNG